MIAAPFATGWLELASLAFAGLATFVLPGAVLLAAATATLRHDERLAFSFASSLALLTATFATCLLLQVSIAAAPAVLAAVTIAAAVVVRFLGAGSANAWSGTEHTESETQTRAANVRCLTPSSAPVVSRVALVLLVIASLWAAVVFAPVGSVDRWWYLAYVRGYLDSAALTTAEPFLGTGQTFARFGIHPWLFGLAMWSWLAGLDPVLVYERGAPVLVVLASVSAACSLARRLFGGGPLARLCIVATMLLWSGALVPVLARAGEDKVLAAAALLPLCVAAFLRVVDEPNAISPRRRSADLFLLALAAAATAAVHALAYAFVLVALLPTAAVLSLRTPALRRSIAAAATLLLVVALAPAVSGLVVRERLHAIGAELAAEDHPVVRVHEGRDRLVDLPSGGFVVTPRLLFHPLTLLALAGLPLLLRRRPEAGAEKDDNGADRGEAPLDESARWLLATVTVAALAIAFLPPLPALAGEMIPPWMVYRVLWLLPLAPLAALAAHRLASRGASRESVAMLGLLVLGLPMMVEGTRGRLAEVRARKAAPADEDFRGLIDAVTALPAAARIAAPPELSERLPALTARAVVAGLDRSTVVFAGSRELGEARLRARAAVLAGDADAAALARVAGVVPSHAVYDPRANLQPRCATPVFARGGYALCELALDQGSDASFEQLEALVAPEVWIVAEGSCEPAATTGPRDPWSATAPVANCRIDVPPEWRESNKLLLVLRTKTGRAVDELRVSVRSPDGSVPDKRTVYRTSGEAAVALPIGSVPVESLEIRIESSFLPALRLGQVALAAR